MLRLVSPAPEGQGTGTPKRRRGSRSPSLFLTPDEVRHAQAAIRAAARAYGGQDVLATVLGIPVHTLQQAASRGRSPSGILVIRLAAAAGLTVEAVLSGKLTEAGRCPTCGAKRGGAS